MAFQKVRLAQIKNEFQRVAGAREVPVHGLQIQSHQSNLLPIQLSSQVFRNWKSLLFNKQKQVRHKKTRNERLSTDYIIQ